MAEWVYKATTTKVDLATTAMLADVRGFLCRSAYSERRVRVSNVSDVATGDVIHFFYVRSGKTAAGIGSFEIVAAETHVRPEIFGDRVDGTQGLYRVGDKAFAEKLAAMGDYVPDPVLGCFTGWPIKKIGRAPKYAPALFTARATLQR